MPSCPNCHRAAPEGSRFCPNCASALGDAPPITETSLPSQATEAVPSSSYPSQTGDARFLPGSMVADRYRVVGLLGVGGMGEVYRADDLKLGQPVALKFLPREVERDEKRRQRFMNEVRLALRITHPNVCRVHDIGEVPSAGSGQERQHFISMEYVDGEDLASLLRRIGHMPEERAVEIARQLCAGLAAAHDQGILHRDLKPANVMIDGRGRAKITDFGLADLAGTVVGAEVRAGTPGYMAPEQLSGSGVSERSDIYSLGLVLYELFTGKQAFRPGSAAEMARLQTTPPTSPTSHVRGLDPAIEAVVLRALEQDPARRPASAMAVAAALPGGDPLAAALAAGETPSPEMVAEAGEAGGMAPGWVALALGVILAGLVGIGLLRPENDALGWIETPLSVSAVRERARLMVERLGYDEPTNWTAFGVSRDGDYVRWLREETTDMRQRVAAERPPVYLVWYRQSPERMVPVNRGQDSVSEQDPPLTVPGMVRVQLDPQARLVGLTAVPPDRDPEDAAGPDDLWGALFSEADLDAARFTAVAPSRTPPVFADARAAWEGTLAEAPETTLRVEAAAYQGRAVSFRITGPWTRDRGEPAEPRPFEMIGTIAVLSIFVSMLLGIGFLARRNLRNGRSDLRGAVRIGGYLFVVESLSRLAAAGFLFGPSSFGERFVLRLSEVVFLAATVFMAYTALEPYVRRLWPSTLISWTRLVAGRFRDPLIGRDLLIGAAAGVLTQLLWASHVLLPPVLGLPEEPLVVGAHWRAGTPAIALGRVLTQAGGAVGVPMLMLLSLVLLRLLFRNSWVAIGIFFAVSTVLPTLDSEHFALDLAVRMIVQGLSLFVVLRVGLMALVGMTFFSWLAANVMTLDPGSWVGTTAMIQIVALLVVAAYAALVALGGRALLQDEL
jgi:serine/threonine-protein kinase